MREFAYRFTDNTPFNRPLQASVGKPVILNTDERTEVAKAICEVAQKNKFKILACSILPDHVHMVIADMGEDIKKIVNNIKGYSSFHVNRTLKGTVQGGGRQLHLWSKSFNDSYLNDEEHLFKAINYAQNNYLKHEGTWGILNNKKVDEILTDVIVPFRKWEDFEYTSGGFDAVIGNPPYVNAKILVELFEKERNYITSITSYKTPYQKWDLYIAFIEKGLKLLKNNGFISMIIPYPFLNQTYAKVLRQYILENFDLIEIVDLSNEKIFKDATVTNCIFVISNSKPTEKLMISHIRNKIIEKISSKTYNELILSKDTYTWDLNSVEKGYYIRINIIYLVIFVL